MLDFPWVTDQGELIKFGDVCPPQVVRLWMSLRNHGMIPYILSFMGEGRDEGGAYRERAWLFRQSLAEQLAAHGYSTSYAETVDMNRVFLQITENIRDHARGKAAVCKHLGTRLAIDDRCDNCTQLIWHAGVLPYQIYDVNNPHARPFSLPREIVQEALRIDEAAPQRVYRRGAVRHFHHSDRPGHPGSGLERVVMEILEEYDQRTIFPKLEACWRMRNGGEAGHRPPGPRLPRPGDYGTLGRP